MALGLWPELFSALAARRVEMAVQSPPLTMHMDVGPETLALGRQVHEGGVRLSPKRDRRIEMDATDTARRLVLEVRDEG